MPAPEEEECGQSIDRRPRRLEQIATPQACGGPACGLSGPQVLFATNEKFNFRINARYAGFSLT
jgi:hypothetical protein